MKLPSGILRQSRIPYAILSHRPSGSDRGVVSAITHREISSARSDGPVALRDFDSAPIPTSDRGLWRRGDADTSSSPSCASAAKRGTPRNVRLSRARARFERITLDVKRAMALDDTDRVRRRSDRPLRLMPPSMNSGASPRAHHASAS